MRWDLLLGALFSSMAGLTLALVTALITDHREKRRWLQTKVHQPMYDELTNVISGRTPWADNEYESLWADLEYYKTYRVDVELSEALDRYASQISELARLEHEDDFDAFVRALPDEICPGAADRATLPSGRTLDMQTWLRRNGLVLATHPSLGGRPVGFEPGALDYLWAEVDGIDRGVEETPPKTARALEAVSTEFNWGYESFYRHWEDGWVDALVDALVEADGRPESALQELLSRRRDLGIVASEARDLIEARTERGLFRSLWAEWRAR